ncbi:MAG: hypothetical protein AAF642_16030 [Pseudomonadota bacterium]
MTSATRPWGRLLVGTFMGYLAATCATSAFAALLPIPRSEAVYMSLILISLVWVSLFIYVFAIASWLRGLRDLTLIALIGAVILALNKLVFVG